MRTRGQRKTMSQNFSLTVFISGIAVLEVLLVLVKLAVLVVLVKMAVPVVSVMIVLVVFGSVD